MGDFELIASDLQFPEGPIWLSDGSVVLVEIARQTLTRVSADGKVDVVAELGGGPNGAAIGPDGKVYVCNNGGMLFHRTSKGGLVPGEQPEDYAGGSIQRVDLDTGEVETLYTDCGGERLKGPNDIVFDSTGGFWFTDLGKTRPRDLDRGGLYYAQPDGSSVTEVAFPLGSPNGVGLSPAGDRVYWADTNQGRVFYLNLSGPGQVSEYRGPEHRPELLAGLGGWQLLDSLAVDSGGNVCVATIRNGGITVISPEGEVSHVPTDDTLTTNICFGGADLTDAYITLSMTGRLVKTRWARPGLELAFNR